MSFFSNIEKLEYTDDIKNLFGKNDAINILLSKIENNIKVIDEENMKNIIKYLIYYFAIQPKVDNYHFVYRKDHPMYIAYDPTNKNFTIKNYYINPNSNLANDSIELNDPNDIIPYLKINKMLKPYNPLLNKLPYNQLLNKLKKVIPTLKNGGKKNKKSKKNKSKKNKSRSNRK